MLVTTQFRIIVEIRNACGAVIGEPEENTTWKIYG
jgi:hypothetical protein